MGWNRAWTSRASGPRVEILVLNCNLTNVTQMIQPFGNSINSVEKALDLTTPAKNRAKISIIDLNFQIKKIIG